jgi:hypothetical protein
MLASILRFAVALAVAVDLALAVAFILALAVAVDPVFRMSFRASRGIPATLKSPVPLGRHFGHQPLPKAVSEGVWPSRKRGVIPAALKPF